MSVGETIENYLETLHILLQDQKKVRSVDLAYAMNFSKPTISVMMKQLREKNLIAMDHSGYLSLTPEGLAIAERVYERHVYLTDLLIRLGVNEETAAEDACKIEHVISRETFEKIRDFFEQEEEPDRS
ncbi:MAG: metal-dependent transcriptional regulator [Clostridiaceae bacterium]|nr:metal-dependent transcriptional regulator [Clostridiaceae bacterium]